MKTNPVMRTEPESYSSDRRRLGSVTLARSRVRVRAEYEFVSCRHHRDQRTGSVRITPFNENRYAQRSNRKSARSQTMRHRLGSVTLPGQLRVRVRAGYELFPVGAMVKYSRNNHSTEIFCLFVCVFFYITPTPKQPFS